MHLGIDFGTTRTIVALADRGNYPVVGFEDAAGDSHDHLPSVVAATPDGLVFGHAALAAHRDGAPLVRSFKRLLADPGVRASTPVRIGDTEIGLLDLLTRFLTHVREQLAEASTVADHAASAAASGVVGNVVVAVPAHAHGAQRFLTLEAFRRAGFAVTALLNEPSAAGFEYTHRQVTTLNSKRTRVVVHDLGGGTFDASLVTVDGTSHEVLDSTGLNRLGGDDFDEVLTELAVNAAGRPALSAQQREALLDECRDAKEKLTPQSRRLVVDVAGSPVVITVDDFYAAVTPLVDRIVQAMAPLTRALDDPSALAADIAGIYLVGGGSSLPLVPRMLRERFGRRVHRAPIPAASTAIGLAVAADPSAGYSLTERLSRGFGVFREQRGGARVGFDPLLSHDQVVRLDEPVSVSRRYRAAHNVGWFRFVEYGSVDAAGEPRGDLVPFAEVLFPFDAALQGAGPNVDLARVEVERREHGPLIEETYTVDPNELITVRITDLDTGYSQTHTLQDAAAS